MVKEEAPLGLVLVREQEEEALRRGWQDQPPLDVVALAAIPVQQPLPTPRELSELHLKVSGLPEGTLGPTHMPSTVKLKDDSIWPHMPSEETRRIFTGSTLLAPSHGNCLHPLLMTCLSTWVSLSVSTMSDDAGKPC